MISSPTNHMNNKKTPKTEFHENLSRDAEPQKILLDCIKQKRKMGENNHIFQGSTSRMLVEMISNVNAPPDNGGGSPSMRPSLPKEKSTLGTTKFRLEGGMCPGPLPSTCPFSTVVHMNLTVRRSIAKGSLSSNPSRPSRSSKTFSTVSKPQASLSPFWLFCYHHLNWHHDPTIHELVCINVFFFFSNLVWCGCVYRQIQTKTRQSKGEKKLPGLPAAFLCWRN